MQRKCIADFFAALRGKPYTVREKKERHDSRFIPMENFGKPVKNSFHRAVKNN